MNPKQPEKLAEADSYESSSEDEFWIPTAKDDVSKRVDEILSRITVEVVPLRYLKGCSDAELDGLARYLDVPLPAAFRRVLERCGKFDGYTFLSPPESRWGSTFWDMLELHAEARRPIHDGKRAGETDVPAHLLVFRCLEHPWRCFHCLDPAKGEDPPVLEIRTDSRSSAKGDRPAVQIANRFTEYLSAWVDEGILQRKAHLTALRGLESAALADGPHARVFALLASIRQRPGMYVPFLQLGVLETLLWGFEVGMAPTGQFGRGSTFHAEFRDFIDTRRKWSMSAGWATGIRANCPTDERAWQVFFELLDEFREFVQTESTRP